MRLFGPTYKMKIKVPPGLRTSYMEDKLRFIGTKSDISKLAEEIRNVSKLKNGQICRLDKLTLKVSVYITEDLNKEHWVELPNHAWNIMASKFQEVVEEIEDNPFDFNDCSYMSRIPFDIGIEITDL